MAVIDDGVNEDIYNIGNLIHNIEITRDLIVHQRTSFEPNLPTHGTTCAAIIKKYAPDVSLSSVRVLDDKCRGLKDQVIKAIEWCLEEEMNVVNLSLGTIHHRDFSAIKRVVNEASRRGIIIVAACNNRDVYTCPASLSSVIGVKHDRSGRIKEGQFKYNTYPFDGIEITACGFHNLKDIRGKIEYVYPANSYAAPLITAEACNLIQTLGNLTTIEDIKLGLQKRSVNFFEEYNPHLYKNIDWVEKAQVFYLASTGLPVLNKEYCFKSTKLFNIQCDCVDEGLKKITEKLKKKEVDGNTRDSIIIVLKDNSVGNVTRLYELYEYCSKTNTNLVVTGNKNLYIKHEELKGNIKFWQPSMFNFFYRIKNKNKESSETPIIIIYNLSKKSIIKFLCLLRSFFRKDGYYAVVISDNYEGVLYNLELLPRNFLDMIGIEGNLLLHPYIDTYYPDVLVLGLSVNNYNLVFESIEVHLKPDVRLIVVDETFDCNSLPAKKSDFGEIIIVSLGDLKNQSNLWKTFNCCNHKTVKELYYYIIELFKNEG